MLPIIQPLSTPWPPMPGEVPGGSSQSQVLDRATRTALVRRGERTVMPLFGNARMLPMLKNLLCSADRAGMHHWFVIAFDEIVCQQLAHDFGLNDTRYAAACVSPYHQFEAAVHGSNSTFGSRPETNRTVAKQTSQGGQSGIGNAAVYRSRLFNAIMCHRVGWLRLLLAAGFNILHCDVDVVILRDPLPLFEKPILVRPSGHTATYRDSDMLVQSEGVFGNNGGFYYVRASNRTVALFDALLRRFFSKVNNSNTMFEDQHCLNDVLRDGRKRRKGLRVMAPKLNQTLFPTGLVWSHSLSSKAVAFIVHMNWARHSKKAKLVYDGLWFLNSDDTRCDASSDPHEGGCDRACVPLRPGTMCELGRPCVYADCAELDASARRGRPYQPVALQRAGCAVPQVHRESRAERA